MNEIEQAQAILDYLVSHVVRRPGIQLTADSSLVASGLIDSFALVDVLTKLEEVTATRISAGKVQPKDMDTVNLMLATAKRVGKARPPKS
jgi:acyl carrier protein